MATRTTSGHSPAGVPEHPWLYWMLWSSGVMFIVVTLLIAYAKWDFMLFEGSGIDFGAGPTLVLIAGLYLALSLGIAGPDDLAGAFCYGKALKRLVSGPHFVPLFLMQLKKESKLVQEFQCPDEPDNVFKGDDKDPLPEGMVRPIRIVTGPPDPKEPSKGILDTQMTLVVSFTFQYAITDIFSFKANYGTIERLQMQLRDTGEATIGEDATKVTANGFITSVPEMNIKLRDEVDVRFGNSGVNIISARLLPPDITHSVSGALADIPIARARAQRTEIRAGAFETLLVKRGTGRASAELSMLKAKSEGRKLMKDQLGVDGDAILASEAVRDLSSKTDTLVVGAQSGMRDVMSLVKGAQSALKPKTATKGVAS